MIVDFFSGNSEVLKLLYYFYNVFSNISPKITVLSLLADAINLCLGLKAHSFTFFFANLSEF